MRKYDFVVFFIFNYDTPQFLRKLYFNSIQLFLYNEITGTPNPDPNPQPPTNCPTYRGPPYSGTIFNFPNVVKATGYF